MKMAEKIGQESEYLMMQEYLVIQGLEMVTVDQHRDTGKEI